MITFSGSASMRGSRGSTSTFTEPPSGDTTHFPDLIRITLPQVPPTISATWSKRITCVNRGSARFVRYEQVKIFNGLLKDEEQARVVPGVVFAIRQNLHLSTEVYIDTRGVDVPNPDIPESTCQWITTLWWAY